MNERQKIATAYEYSSISNAAARIANDIQNILTYVNMYGEKEDAIRLMEVKSLMTEYHFKFSFSSLEKELNQTT